MSSVESKLAVTSRKPAPASGIRIVPEAGANPANGNESRKRDDLSPGSGTDENWFYDCAVAVFGDKETGQLLHLATGWPRTNCYAYVARDPEQRRKPPLDLVRHIIHSPHGKPFHDAFMRGNTAPWYLDHQRNVRLAAAAERFKREIDSSAP